MTLPKFISLMFAACAVTAAADTVTVTGLENDGNAIGQYVIGGQTYWWLCIEPGPAALSNQTITAQTYSFANGWNRQNTERYGIYQADLAPPFSGDLTNIALPKQIVVMQYVLDTYLPWADAGPSGRFLDQSGAYTDFNSNTNFFNSMYAVQNFLADTYGSIARDSFTAASFADPNGYQDFFAPLHTATGDARSTIFQNILSDVQAKDLANFFDTYTAQHDYGTLNTFAAENDSNNWQDGLIIGFNPVPEPGGALLIASCGVAWTLRRRRRIG